HRADVAIAYIAKNSLLQTARGFVHHGEHAAAYHLLVGNADVLTRACPRAGADDLIDGVVDVTLLAARVVLVKAISSLAAEPTGGDDTSHRLGGRHAQTERVGQDEPDFAADVDTDFIEKGARTHRNPEIEARAV